MWADDKSLPKVRICIIGAADVGKSALIVRYLTGRFIGEYRSNTDLLYQKVLSLETGQTEVEVVDVYMENEEERVFPMEQVLWADGCIVVYSITDRSSFDYAAQCLANLKAMQNAPIAYLVGSKGDLDHLRKIPEKDGAALAAAHSVGFCEVSVADNSPNLSKAFEKLIHDSKSRNQKQNRKFSVSKMIGNLMGSSGSKQNLPNTQGTVTPCNKDELQRSRVVKRRQGYVTTSI